MEDEEIKWVLEENREEIVRDLQPRFILKDLEASGAIDAKEVNLISVENTDEKQAAVLLDVIRKKGRPLFTAFLNSLLVERKYDWLADSLIKRQKTFHLKVGIYRDKLARGGVPQLPQHMLTRTCLQEQIKNLLIGILKSVESGWVVIHGMPGSGKSLLAAAALRSCAFEDELLLRNIFWIRIGNSVNEEGLLTKIHMLCEKLDASYRDSLPCNIEMASDRLRALLHSDVHKNSLIVLDDVWDDYVIRHFDLGSPILLTTRDKSVMDVTCSKVHYVELNNGFTLDESRRFLSCSLSIKEECLPQSVDEICSRTKGCPLVMAIISAVIRRHPSDIDKSLKMCLNKLKDKSLIIFQHKSPYQYPCIEQALKMSVDSLQEEKEHYFDLAIFPNEFYIYGQVLETLWRMDAFQVEEIMNSFIDKSVAVQVSNGHKSNSYTVHDLFLDYIRNTQAHNLMHRHRRLIENYLQKCGGKYEDLPNDGYILLFLGHHLKEGQMYNKFSEVFLNLKVLILKLSVVGPADVLGDFIRYESYIIQNGKYSKEWKDFKEFVSSTAHLTTDHRYDVLQVALCQPSDSVVYSQARKLCVEKVEYPYFEWCNRDRLKNSCILSTQLQQQSVNCASYFNDGNHIVFGGDEGLLKILKSSSGKEMLTLKGHTKKINWLANYKNPLKKREVIVSCSSDCTVVVWLIRPEDLRGKKKVENVGNAYFVFKKHSAAVLKCCVSKNGIIASLDSNGEVKIWNYENGIEYAGWEVHPGKLNYGDCHLSSDGKWLLTTTGTYLGLWDVSKQIAEWEMHYPDGFFVACCFTPDCKEVLATLNFKVIVYCVEKRVAIYTLVEPNKINLLQCAISEDGSLIAASTTQHAIVIWNRTSREVIDYIHGHKQWVHSVAFSPLCKESDRNSHMPLANVSSFSLVSAGNDGTVMVWKISSTSVSEETVRDLEVILRDVFAAQFDSNNEPIIAAVDMNNKVKVYNGKQHLIVGENGSKLASFNIRCNALSNKRDRVLYGCTRGHLKVFDIGTSVTNLLVESKKFEVCCCTFSSDDALIAAGYEDGRVLILRKDKIETQGHKKTVTCLKFYSSDLKLISCSFDNTLKVWNTVNGNLLFVCQGHNDSVVSCDVSADGRLIASASTDKSLMIWNSSNGNRLLHLNRYGACIRTCKFSPNGYLLASGDDNGSVKLWYLENHSNSESVHMNLDLYEMKDLAQASSPTRPQPDHVSRSWICDIKFSSDGSRLVFCSDVIQWWTTSNVRLLQKFPIRGSKVTSIYCSPDFRSLVTIDDTGVLYYLKQINCDKKSSYRKDIIF